MTGYVMVAITFTMCSTADPLLCESHRFQASSPPGATAQTCMLAQVDLARSVRPGWLIVEWTCESR